MGKKAYLIVSFFLFSLNMVYSQEKWKQNEFVIGTCVDPRLTLNNDSVMKDLASFQLAKDAYFNLLTGEQADVSIPMNYETARYALSLAKSVGLKYIVKDTRFYSTEFNQTVADEIIRDYSGLGELRDAFYGYSLRDEPTAGEVSRFRPWISFFKERDPSKVAFINLLPVYGFDSMHNYESYLDSYLNSNNEAENLDLVSYDHYFPEKDFYYNLAIIKEKSKGRPFWAYPLTNRLNNHPIPTPSNIRLEAFAPIAYGAKGLIYYTYDYVNDNKILINYNDSGDFGGWDETWYLNFETETEYVFTPADFDGDSIDDLAAKTYDGNWYIDYSKNGFGSWDSTFCNRGHNYYAQSAIADYDGDGKMDLSVKTTDGTWYVDYAKNSFLRGWDIFNMQLPNKVIGHADIPMEQINSAIAVPADYDGDGCADMAIKTDSGHWLIKYTGINGEIDTLFTSWDVIFTANELSDPNAQFVAADYDGDGKADLCVKTANGFLYINYAKDGFTDGWDLSIELPLGSISPEEIQSAKLIPADFDGNGRTDIAIKADGHWFIKRTGENSIEAFDEWDTVLQYYGGSDYTPYALNLNNDKYADICEMAQDLANETIINRDGTKTALYDSVRLINKYITKFIAPVVMNTEHIGAFHKSSRPTMEVIPDSSLINRNTPIIKDADENLLIGIFKENVSPKYNNYYLLVVNKDTEAINNPKIFLKGNFQSSVNDTINDGIYVTPSLFEERDSVYSKLSPIFNAGSIVTQVTIPGELKGGEGRLLKITNVSNYFSRNNYSDFDGDGKSDLNFKTSDTKWHIDLAYNGFGAWDYILPEYGGDDALPVPADYDGNGKADLSVKTADSWYIDYMEESPVFGWDSRIDIRNSNADPAEMVTALPAPADFDGDGKADLSLKTNSTIWYIDYAKDGLGSWERILPEYGANDALPVPADYDGDGKADLSVKTTDSWYIDYMRPDPPVFGWDLWVSLTEPNGAQSIMATGIPVPSDYDGDGKADLCIKGDNGKWYIDFAYNGFGAWDLVIEDGSQFNNSFAKPFSADYDGDGIGDRCIRTTDGVWYIDYAYNGFSRVWDDTIRHVSSGREAIKGSMGDVPTEITDRVNDNISYFQNAETKAIQVIFPDQENKYDINVFDQLGQRKLYMNNVVGAALINYSNLQPGIFIISVIDTETKNRVSNHKFISQ